MLGNTLCHDFTTCQVTQMNAFLTFLEICAAGNPVPYCVLSPRRISIHSVIGSVLTMQSSFLSNQDKACLSPTHHHLWKCLFLSMALRDTDYTMNVTDVSFLVSILFLASSVQHVSFVLFFQSHSITMLYKTSGLRIFR